jgi:hypothetical protein
MIRKDVTQPGGYEIPSFVPPGSPANFDNDFDEADAENIADFVPIRNQR